MMALNSMIIKSEIECNNNPRNSAVVAANATKIKCGGVATEMNNNNKKVIQSTPTPNGSKMGSRRIFTPQFKLQVLDSYRTDSDCKGNQRATARKYGIHRRQIQKWLQVEQTLRTVVANNLANSNNAAANNSNSINNPKLLTNHQHHHHHHQIVSNNNNSNVMLKNNYINPTTELKISYDTTRHRVAPNNNNNNSHVNNTLNNNHHYHHMKSNISNSTNNVIPTTNTTPTNYYIYNNTANNDIVLPYHHQQPHNNNNTNNIIIHQYHQNPIMQPHTSVLYHDLAPSTSLSSQVLTTSHAPGYEHHLHPQYEPHYPTYPMYNNCSPKYPSPPPPAPEFTPIRLPYSNESSPIDLSLPPTERKSFTKYYNMDETRRPTSPHNWEWKNHQFTEENAKPQFTDLSNANCQAWDLSCRKRTHVADDTDDDGRGSTSGDSCRSGDDQPTPAKTVKLFQPYLMSDEEKERKSQENKSTDPIIWSHHQQNYIRSSLFVQDYAYMYPSPPYPSAVSAFDQPQSPPTTTLSTSPIPTKPTYWVSQGSPVSGYDSSTSISSVFSESAETLSNYSLDFKLQAIDAYYHDTHCQGSQKAVASKYNIDRQLIERWLQQETDLRQRLVI
jgi:transposase-like protein